MKTKTAEEIMAKINPSTPHSLTVWTDEMVIQAMHEYASQGPEAVGNTSDAGIRALLDKIILKVVNEEVYFYPSISSLELNKILASYNQPSSRHQQNGSPASPSITGEELQIKDKSRLEVSVLVNEILSDVPKDDDMPF